MSADRYRRIAHRARRIPGKHGLRPYTVAILTGSWSGTYTGSGTETATTTAITEADGQPPKLRFIDDEDRMISELPTGSIEVGPITPTYGAALSTLKPSLSTGDTVYLLVTGPEFPDGARFEIVSVSTDRALQYVIKAKPVTL